MIYVCVGLILTLLLVASAHLLQVFIFWALLSLVVCLLVGFVFEDKEVQKASLCIFVLDRVGEIPFLMGLWGCYVLFKDFDIEGIVNFIPHYADQTLLIFNTEVLALPFIASCVAMACLVKSGQIGFHFGLYHAIKAPMASCALIFTLFTVGVSVYLICRLSLLFDSVDWVRALFLWVGLLSSVFLALVASVKHNIKHVLVCASCSQTGYIYVALGLSGYGVALFLWVTFVLFQTLLFLGGRSIMRALSQESNMRLMGGIKNKIPITYLFMGIGCLSLVGVPFFSGFFSKMSLFELALGTGSIWGRISLGIMALSILVTAYYALRLMWGVFHGSMSANEQVKAHIEESPAKMLVPMGFLAFGCILAGYLSYGFFIENNQMVWGNQMALGKQELALAIAEFYTTASPKLMWVGSILVFGFMAFFALKFYERYSYVSRMLVKAAPELYSFINNSAYTGRIYGTLIEAPFWKSSTFLNSGLKKHATNLFELANGVTILRKISIKVNRLHSRNINKNVKIILVAGVLVTGIFVSFLFWGVKSS